MYHYIEDKEFLKDMRRLCSDIVNQLVQRINNDGQLYVKAYLVGSGARNMITQNANEPIDLDYNLCIIDAYDIYINDGNAIKEHIRNHFNAVLKRNGWGDCQDSTSALTTELRYLTKGNNTDFKIDLAIIQERNNACFRLIHRKTGFVLYDQWYWNEAPQSTNLSHRTNNSIVAKQQAVDMAKQGQIAGVGIAHRGNTEYLKSIPNGNENDNLCNLPSVSPNLQA